MKILTYPTFLFFAVLIGTEPGSAANPAPAGKDTTYLNLGGALRFNAFFKNWNGEEDNQNKTGDLKFDTWRINADGRSGAMSIHAEYRFYAGYSFLKSGYIGYELSEHTKLQGGLMKVPFGLLPYASNSWFLSMAYYLGLEDDYDMGVKVMHQEDQWDIRAAFYKNAEQGFTGSSASSARYSYDIIGDNQEVNQGNLRIAYNTGNWKLGVSGQYGQLYNQVTENMGWHHAGAVHATGTYGRWNIKTEVIHYEYAPTSDAGKENFVLMGAYDSPYQVAKQGQLYIAGLSYRLPVDWGPLESLTFYNDFTFFDKQNQTYSNSQMNVGGIMAEIGNVYAYLDAASGQSHPWIGPAWSEALSRGPGENATAAEPAPEWATRFNLNVGYYF